MITSFIGRLARIRALWVTITGGNISVMASVQLLRTTSMARHAPRIERKQVCSTYINISRSSLTFACSQIDLGSSSSLHHHTHASTSLLQSVSAALRVLEIVLIHEHSVAHSKGSVIDSYLPFIPIYHYHLLASTTLRYRRRPFTLTSRPL